jgi:hypothetical protein
MEQNLTILIKNFAEDAMTHATPATSTLTPVPPLCRSPESTLSGDSSDGFTPPNTPCEKSAPNYDEEEWDTLTNTWASTPQDKATSLTKQNSDAQGLEKDFPGTSTTYKHMRAGGNSFQINGDVGHQACRHNTYFDMVSGENSIQLNGSIFDPAIFLNITKC